MSRNSKVSVIIPVYEDPDGIAVTLESLVNQRYSNYEILPVDNNSHDETGEIIDRFYQSYPELVTPLKETEIQSSYAARNTGIEHASGEIYLFIDADMWVKTDWIQQMVRSLESNSCDYLGCNVEVVSDANTLFSEYDRLFGFPVEDYINRGNFGPTCALAVREDVVADLGGFDQRLVSSGDKEFGNRVYHAGFSQCYDGTISAYHPARETVWEHIAKSHRIGRGRTQIRYLHPEIGGSDYPISLIDILPPSPWRLKRQCSDYEGSILKFSVFYLTEYLLKMSIAVGSIKEYQNTKR